LILFAYAIISRDRVERKAQLMSTEAIPGSGRDGQEPPVPAPADGFFGEDEDAWLRRVMAETDADEEWISEEQVGAALSGVASGAGRARGDLGGLAQGGPVDVMPPDATLAGLAAGACDPAVRSQLTDNQVLSLAGAGRRLAARGAWIQQTAVAEFASRRLEPDHKKATPLGFTPFAADELVPELVATTSSAEEQMSQARDASRRLPANFALLRDGRISAFQMKIITEATQGLSDEDAAEAAKLLAAAAPGLTPGQLRRHEMAQPLRTHPHHLPDQIHYLAWRGGHACGPGFPAYAAMISSMVGNVGMVLPTAAGITLLSSCPTSR
jgi:Domain of unknown function (DUF222)